MVIFSWSAGNFVGDSPTAIMTLLYFKFCDQTVAGESGDDAGTAVQQGVQLGLKASDFDFGNIKEIFEDEVDKNWNNLSNR